MNKNLKQKLKTAFDAPVPIQKNEFLQTLNYPQASYLNFICCQIGYIRKRVWILSCLLLVGVLYSLYVLEFENTFKIMWLISSILPFLALLAITEIARSTSYNMAELEISCKYSLSNIVLVRFGVLSSFHFVIFGILILCMVGKTDYSFIRLGIYIIVPFLLTCVLSLFVLNKFKSGETMYICGAISCFVGILNSFFSANYQIVFTDKFFCLWCFVFCSLLAAVAMQIIKFLKKMEELNWNLPLTD